MNPRQVRIRGLNGGEPFGDASKRIVHVETEVWFDTSGEVTEDDLPLLGSG